MWGDGLQTRSFTFIDDCVEGILRITKSDFKEPLNLGSSEMVSALSCLNTSSSTKSTLHAILSGGDYESARRSIRAFLACAALAPCREGLLSSANV